MKYIPILFLILIAGSCSTPYSDSKCGNGIIENGEDCEGDQFPHIYDQNCQSLGFNGGTYTCSDSCKLDLSDCKDHGICHDGKLSPLEPCDGELLQHTQCTEIGHHSGTLSCTDDCRYDLSGCEYCGDGIIQTEYGEICDPGKLNTPTCSYFDKWGGPQICNSDCTPNSELCDDVLRISQAYYDNFRYDSLADITFDASGNLYVLGYTGSELPGFENASSECDGHYVYESYESIYYGNIQELYTCWDIFLSKITPAGQTMWSQQWGTTDDDRGFALLNNGQLTAINYYQSKIEIDTSSDWIFETRLFKASTLDFQGNLINSDTGWSSNYHLLKIRGNGPNQIIVAGALGGAPLLRSINLETNEETELSPWENEPGMIILDFTQLDATNLAILTHYTYWDSPDLLQLWKYNLETKELISLNETPDNNTGHEYRSSLNQARRNQAYLLVNHPNGDLYYVAHPPEHDSAPELVRVTTDGSEISRYRLPTHEKKWEESHNFLSISASGNLILANTFYVENDSPSLPNVPEDFHGILIKTSVFDPELSSHQTTYKIISDPDPEKYVEITGIKSWKNTVYIFGIYRRMMNHGFIYRLEL